MSHIIKQKDPKVNNYYSCLFSLFRHIHSIIFYYLVGVTSSSLTSQSPTLLHVHRLLKDHSNQWNELGRVLGVSYNYRQELQSERISNNERLEGVLNEWIVTESVPVTWDRLIIALEEMKLRSVIRSVKEFLNTDEAYVTYSSPSSGIVVVIIIQY